MITSRAEVGEALKRIEEIRAEIDEHEEAVKGLFDERRQLLGDLVSSPVADFNYASLATRLGVHRSRITQLMADGTKSSSFLSWGKNRTYTVLIGSRGDGKSPLPLLYAEFDKLAADTGLIFNYEQIGPNSEVVLTRENLIVACGPSLSIAIHVGVQSDKVIKWVKEPDGRWCLMATVGQDEPVAFRSPYQVYPDDHENAENTDIGYLARLRQPDGSGSFLILAGIHFEGTLGAVRFLRENHASLAKERGRRLFSTLIKVEFDPQSREIISTVEQELSADGSNKTRH